MRISIAGDKLLHEFSLEPLTDYQHALALAEASPTEFDNHEIENLETGKNAETEQGHPGFAPRNVPGIVQEVEKGHGQDGNDDLTAQSRGNAELETLEAENRPDQDRRQDGDDQKSARLGPEGRVCDEGGQRRGQDDQRSSQSQQGPDDIVRKVAQNDGCHDSPPDGLFRRPVPRQNNSSAYPPGFMNRFAIFSTRPLHWASVQNPLRPMQPQGPNALRRPARARPRPAPCGT